MMDQVAPEHIFSGFLLLFPLYSPFHHCFMQMCHRLPNCANTVILQNIIAWSVCVVGFISDHAGYREKSKLLFPTE
jgi:hypothetical protein